MRLRTVGAFIDVLLAPGIKWAGALRGHCNFYLVNFRWCKKITARKKKKNWLWVKTYLTPYLWLVAGAHAKLFFY
ncbi:uncharacterized protein F4822DRAFT_411027 [Hypoxylon trugodes]|uniref:uncharacterized protein n=1 Tax=Hypoxylon trugodes TaxID=326681 RepID=UPI00219FBC9C|nr:uncharacterized protein F4822DRAFT_411027 [Hypoxylon trugodes]KAI1386712.1 hypothetical protein F4822DRAFT_411027 [Hypoxylon trugodes]